MDKITIGNQVLEITPDEDPIDPRGNDNLGKMVLFHRRYSLPNELGISLDSFSSWSELEEILERQHDARVILPVYMLDHSGIWFRNAPFHEDPGGWDSGQVGYIVATKEGILDNFTGWDGDKREPMKIHITKDMLERTREILVAEIEEYSKYSCGDVYNFVLYKINTCDSCRKDNREIEDSCGGFYDMTEIAEYVPEVFRERVRKREFDRETR